MADGKVVIDTELDEKGAVKGFQDVEKVGKKTMSELASASGRSTEDIKADVKSMAESYQKTGMSIPLSYKKAYEQMGVYSESAERKMKNSSEETKDEVVKDADKMGKSHKENSEKSSRSWGGAFSSIGRFSGAVVSGIGTALKATTAVIGTATVAVGGLVSASVKAYASYEQLVGGVDTVFEKSSKKVQYYADNAYKTAGMSANAYMETVTGFSASLLQSLDGNTYKSAEYANSAIVDMSDNANKMGTSMESIKYAYQGFAKQNYTMLDNLKLGYGGTKTEMERLLADATKISGIKYDISSFADVTQAIHVMQTEMGIAGTTAKEASTTIEGSANAMKASWENLLVGISGGGENIDILIDNFKDSVVTFSENIIPIIGKAISTTGSLIVALLPQVFDQIPVLIGQLADNIPAVVEVTNEIIYALVNGLVSAMYSQSGNNGAIIGAIIELLSNGLEELFTLGVAIVDNMLIGIKSALPSIMTTIYDNINIMFETIREFFPSMLQTGIDIILQLALGIAEALPEIIPQIVDIVLIMVNTLLGNMDKIIYCAMQLVIGLGNGLINALPKLVENLPQIIEAIVIGLMENAPKMMEVGLQLILALGVALVTSLPKLLVQIPGLVIKIAKAFTNMRSEFLKIGTDIVNGIWEGLSKAWSWLVDKFKGLTKDLKVTTPTAGGNSVGGNNIPTSSANSLSQMQNAVTSTLSSLQLSASMYGVTNQLATTSGNVQSTPVSIRLVGDADGLFEVIANKNDMYYTRTGESRFNRG